jgi:hypothetical protein
MYALLIALIAVVYGMVKAKESFELKFGNPMKGQNIVSTTRGEPGFRVFGLTPDTCKADAPEVQDGLCYVPCKAGFTGQGPVCWAETTNIGIGKPVGLEPCPNGWSNDGLICREPLRWNSCKWRGLFKECWGGLEGGRLRGRLNGGGICDYPSNRGELPGWLVDKSDPKNYKATHPDRVDGLCYKKCPPDKPNHVPGMPYLCMKGTELAYGRGVGKVPRLIALFS